MMRLLRVICSMDPRGGGPAEGVRSVSGILEGLGHQTEVVSLDDPAAPFLDGNGFVCHALGQGIGGYRYQRGMVGWIERNRSRFDAVVVHGIWQYHSLAAWKAMAGHRVPYFVYPHGMLDPWFGRAYPLKHVKKVVYWLLAERKVLRDARRVLFVSEEERLLARGAFRPYRCREEVVGYGTSGPGEDREGDLGAFHSAFPQLRGRKFLLFLGRIHPKKGCDMLVGAFCDWVRGGGSGVDLVLAGPEEPGHAAVLRGLLGSEALAGRVHWTGMVRGRVKWGVLRAAEALVLPSHQENFGIVVAEALACGTPALVSDRVNIWREVVGDGAGFASPDTPEGTRQLLQSWFELSPAGREMMRGRAAACFGERFDLRKNAVGLARLVAGEVGQPAPRGGGV